MTSNLLINGVEVKPPQDFNVTYNTIDADSSGRNANGDMVRDVITQKVKLELKWGPLNDSEASNILTAVKKAFFTVNYPDPESGKQETKTFYCGDRSLPAYSWNKKFKQIKWQNLSLNLIER
ncbi:hypothetical protein DOK76_03710 [Vagococcus sp. DIV0080]|uniref:Prophage protein n=1 Tax=Candidatus Vagococcus giribetii TaxID=2230876 RepID=A0ABS3HSH4_9ENTE|nr:hypothetical protein [Vagococcus sp. DIV0080]